MIESQLSRQRRISTSERASARIEGSATLQSGIRGAQHDKGAFRVRCEAIDFVGFKELSSGPVAVAQTLRPGAAWLTELYLEL